MDETLLNNTIKDWENALLDLGKRNKMISFKHTGTLTIMEPGFEELYDAIVVKERKLSFQRDVDQDIDPRVYSLTRLLLHLHTDLEVTVGDIKVRGSVSNSRRALKNLRSKAKTVQDEQGLNTLYLVFGFLKWKDSKTSNEIQSPLLLVPVSLTVDSVSTPFCLKRYDDEILVNPALDKYFSDEFNLHLPSFDPDSQSLEDFVDAIEAMIKEKGRFSFLKEVCLGLFSFAKINMYRDLQDNEEKLKSHRIIRALVGEENGITNNEEYFKQFDHDEEKAQDTYQVVDADSSQKDAIELSKRCVSFVLQGPPGTGKSQTITNIIAEALAAKKKILFVSEKMAALDVVYRRLTEVGLAAFCLPLHDHKANKKDIIRKIGANLDLSAERIDIADLVKLQDLDDVRKKLKKYVEDIHESIEPLGMSLYDVFGEVVALKDITDVPLKIDNIESLSKKEMAVLGQEIVKYAKLYSKQGSDWQANPWNGISCNYLSGNEKNRLKDSIEGGLQALALAANHKLLNQSVNDLFTFDGFKGLATILSVIEDGISYKDNWQDDSARAKAKALVQDIIAHCKHIELLESRYDDEVKALGLAAEDNAIDVAYFAKLKFAAELIPEYELLLGHVESPKFNAFLADLEAKKGEYTDLQQKIKEKCGKIGIYEYKWLDLIDFVENNSAVLASLKPCNAWGYKYDEAKELLARLAKSAQSLNQQNSYLTESYGNKILDFDFVEVLDWLKVHNYDFLKLYTAIIADDKACREILNIKIPQIRTFLAELQIKAADYKQALFDVEHKRKEAGYNWDDTDRFEAYCRDNKLKFVTVNPQQCWCDNCDRAIKLIDELISLVAKIRSAELELLKTHDKDVLAIEYAGMLNRFKTEYTGGLFGISKFFNSQYNDDIKTLKRTYRDVKKDISNEEAVALLQRLKSYHDNISDYYAKKRDVQRYIGVENYDLDFGWDKLRKQINLFVEIAYNFESQLHAYWFIADKKYNEYLECFGRVKALESWKTNNNGSSLVGQRYNYYDTDADAISKDLVYVEKCLRAVKDTLIPAEILSGEQLIELLGQVKAFNRDKSAYLALSGDAENLLGVKEYDISYNWNDIRVHLDCFGGLRGLFANPEDIFRFIAGKDKSEVLSLYKDFAGLCEWEKTCNGANYIGSYYNKFATDTDELNNALVTLKDNCSLFVNGGAYIAFLKDENRVGRIENLRNDSVGLSYDYDWLDARENDAVELVGQEITEDVAVWEAIKKNIEKTDIVMNAMENDIAMALIKSTSNELESLKTAVSKVCSCQPAFEAITALYNDAGSSGFNYATTSLGAVAEKLHACADRFADMDDWIEFRDCRNNCIEKGIVKFVDDLTAKTGGTENSLKIFEKAFYMAWLERIVPRFSAVYRFNHDQQLASIDTFSKLDKQQLELARRRIIADLVATMPVKGSQRGEMDILTKEMYKKSKIMPLRKLFANIPNLLLQLKPCLMMSPLSVAYFLDATKYEFDMVIFDEASQIFPEDAVGAIVRGKQVIIAGDSKQMPPTNFFKAGTSMNDDYDYEEDDENAKFDSILDGADNRLHNCTLRWHYRSLNEDLIAFSNRTIYNGELVTFPATTNRVPDTGVEYFFVENGIYEKQKNPNEAKAIVQMIIEHINRFPNRSLGVIAFSTAQQTTIENMLDKYREKHKLTAKQEAFFSENKEEPFFIKNLENVQGDERDTIIFSVCYGKNSAGKMYQRFGPLGRAGGERRLNVAITRAKLNVKLVGSIKASDIEVSDKKAEGIKLLKKYIEFARLGVAALPELEGFGNIKKHDLFVENIAEFLESKGYKLTKGVGSSSYTIDIAVHDPKDDNKYIAGIECDGRIYRSAKTVRDRDALKPSVLRRMGWKLYRVWSTAWMRNAEGEKQRLLKFLNYDEELFKQAIPTKLVPEIIEETPAEPVPEQPVEVLSVVAETDLEEPEAIEEPIEMVPVTEPAETAKVLDSENVLVDEGTDIIENEPAVPIEPETNTTVEEPATLFEEMENVSSETNEFGMAKYRAYDITSYPADLDLSNPYALGDLLYDVVKTEQPICLYMICQRVAPLLGYLMVNLELIKKVEFALYNYCLPTLIQENQSFYIEGHNNNIARYSELGNPDREVQYVPKEELAEIVQRILRSHTYCTRARLNGFVGKVLGYGKLSQKDKGFVTSALNRLEAEGLIGYEGSLIHWLED